VTCEHSGFRSIRDHSLDSRIDGTRQISRTGKEGECMKSKLLHDEMGLKTFALVFDKDDEVRESLLEFANANRLGDSHVSAIGAFSEVTLGYSDRDQKNYKKIPVRDQVEVLALTGNIVQNDGRASLHAHVVVGKSDGSAHGGHLLGGRVWPTLEMIVSELPVHLRRSLDEETGLALIRLAA
jgi:predicted DNA-binding protein with PD1-like motif